MLVFSILRPEAQMYDALKVPVVQHRAESPNSLLDIEVQRRHTVIGNTDIDEMW